MEYNNQERSILQAAEEKDDVRRAKENGRGVIRTMILVCMLLTAMVSFSACRAADDLESAVESGMDDGTEGVGGDTSATDDGIGTETGGAGNTSGVESGNDAGNGMNGNQNPGNGDTGTDGDNGVGNGSTDADRDNRAGDNGAADGTGGALDNGMDNGTNNENRNN